LKSVNAMKRIMKGLPDLTLLFLNEHHDSPWIWELLRDFYLQRQWLGIRIEGAGSIFLFIYLTNHVGIVTSYMESPCKESFKHEQVVTRWKFPATKRTVWSARLDASLMVTIFGRLSQAHSTDLFLPSPQNIAHPFCLTYIINTPQGLAFLQNGSVNTSR